MKVLGALIVLFAAFLLYARVRDQVFLSTPGAVKRVAQEASTAYDQKLAARAALIGPANQENRLILGMTSDEVIASWGQPEKINPTYSGSHVDEQWIYEGHNRYLYFTDGILRTVQGSLVYAGADKPAPPPKADKPGDWMWKGGTALDSRRR